MAAYYTSGYGQYVPAGYQSRNGVAAMQQQLNAQGASLKVDGIWGPKTDAAYTAAMQQSAYQQGSYPQAGAYGGAGAGYGSTDLGTLYQQVLGVLNPPSISYAMPSNSSLAAENASILRPAYDHAITQRQQQTLYNRAEIDVDAASRGMGRSSYVTDVKDRAMDAEAADIARLEGEYAAALAAAVQEQYNRHLANKLAADQYNAQAMAAAQNTAFGYATTLHGSNLAAAQAMAQAASGSGGARRSGKSSGSGALSGAMQKELQNTALGIYGSTGSGAELDRAIADIYTVKPYDGAYQDGASDYVAGILSGLR